MIEKNQVPGRMGLLVTLFLISSNIYSSLQAPQTRGFSYLDVWMVGVNGLILFAIFEYGIILAWKKYSNGTTSVSNNDIKTKLITQRTKNSWFIINEMTKEEKIKIIDMFSFVMSIVFFILFYMCYWIFV